MKKILTVLLIMTFVSLWATASTALEQETFADEEHDEIITLRAGGGGSSGGGGSGGGGSSGTRINPQNSNRRSDPISTIFSYILFIFISASGVIVFRFKLSKYARNSKKLMKLLENKDSAWKYTKIQKQVKDAYFAIQNAWGNRNLEPARQYLSEECYDSFNTKINWMIHRNEKNVLKNIRLLDASPVSVHDNIDNTLDHVWFYIKGSMIDYTINEKTNEKINGQNGTTRFEEYWQFTRQEDNRWVLNKILQKDEGDRINFQETVEE